MEEQNRKKLLSKFLNDDIRSLIIKLAIPSILGTTLSAAYNLVDAAFVGRLGTIAVAAVNVGLPVVLIISALGAGLGAGVGSYLSRLLGEEEYEKANSAASTIIFYALLLGAGVTFILLLCLSDILPLFGASSKVLPSAIEYTSTLSFGQAAMILCMICGSTVRAEGDTKFSMWTMVMAFGLNAILDPIFIFGFSMGVKGAALATVVSQCIALFAYLVYFVQRRGVIRIHLKYVRLTLELFKEVVLIGIPVMVNQLLIVFAFSLIYRASEPFGEEMVAGVGLAFRVLTLGMFPVLGFCMGAKSVIGVNYGARRFDRVFSAVKIMLIISLCYTSIFSLISLLFSVQIIGFFVNEPEVILVGAETFFALNIFFPLFSVLSVCIVFLQTIGKSKPAGIVTLARQGFILIPIVFLLPYYLGKVGVIYSQPIAELLAGILAIILLYFEMKKMHRRI